MDAVGGLLTGFSVILTPENLYLCFLGSLIGTLVGVLPGVGPLAALALLLPITFTLTPVGGMVMLASIFYGAMYGGSTTSILLNIPGEAASVVTCLDGHQMAKQGRAGAALGIAAIGSFVAGTLGVIVMTFFAPAIAAVAIRFGPPENFAVMVLGVEPLVGVGGEQRALRGLDAHALLVDALRREPGAELGARHILIPPRTPRWNGKIERFFRTLDSEWAHGRTWPDSTTRDRALSSFMRFYNRRRPHTAAGGRPPITRVQQVREQDS